MASSCAIQITHTHTHTHTLKLLLPFIFIVFPHSLGKSGARNISPLCVFTGFIFSIFFFSFSCDFLIVKGGGRQGV